MIVRNLVVLFGFTNAMKIGVACILMYGWPCSSPYVFLSIQKTARFREKSQSAIVSGGCSKRRVFAVRGLYIIGSQDGWCGAIIDYLAGNPALRSAFLQVHAGVQAHSSKYSRHPLRHENNGQQHDVAVFRQSKALDDFGAVDGEGVAIQVHRPVQRRARRPDPIGHGQD
jgi:hypothetical protein